MPDFETVRAEHYRSLPLEQQLYHARIEGYAHGLDGHNLVWAGKIARLFTGDTMGGLPRPQFDQLLAAFQAGRKDGYLAYAKSRPDKFVSPERAAELKGVALNTLYRTLRSAKAEYIFISSAFEGDGKRRIWHISTDDICERWKPANTKPRP